MCMKNYLFSFLILAGMMSCQQEDGFAPEEDAKSSQDLLTRSGADQEYESVVINGIRIMTKNLNVGTFASTVGEVNYWQFDDAGIQKWGYDDVESNCDSLGGLYEWWEMMTGGYTDKITTARAQSTVLSGDISSWDTLYGIKTIQVGDVWHVQGICPDGWHLPSREEWLTIVPSETAAPTELGLTLSGRREYNGRNFQYADRFGFYWSSTPTRNYSAWYRRFSNGSNLSEYVDGARSTGHPVRCVKTVESSDLRILYSINFNRNWTPSPVFNEVFELVDENGTVVTTASSKIKKFRFKLGKEGYKGVTSARDLFFKCTSLVSIELPDWGECTSCFTMFNECTSLTSVTLPDTWGEITNVDYMFNVCQSLTSINLPNNWGKITSTYWMFRLCGFSNITIPDNWGSITNIKEMFLACHNLKSINLPKSWGNIINAIGAFRECYILKFIELPLLSPTVNYSRLFTSTGFSSKDIGVENPTGYVASPSYGVFPSQAWKTGIGLDDLPNL